MPPTYINKVTGTTTLSVPADWELVFAYVAIDGAGTRLIPFNIHRGTLDVGNTYGMRNGYYENAGNNAYVILNINFKNNYTLDLSITTAILTGTEYKGTSLLSASYIKRGPY